MTNHYEVAEVNEIGNARDLILGSDKSVEVFDDGIGQPKRTELMSDDE